MKEVTDFFHGVDGQASTVLPPAVLPQNREEVFLHHGLMEAGKKITLIGPVSESIVSATSSHTCGSCALTVRWPGTTSCWVPHQVSVGQRQAPWSSDQGAEAALLILRRMVH